MKSEKEMMDLILNMAKEDERIRAVIMNGSRVNPNAPKDFFQDYDVVFVVTEVEPFVQERSWTNRFGELMILQTPNDMGESAKMNYPWLVYLMQFMDGNRIDLTFYPIERLSEMESDSLSVLLLDKDDIFEPFPPPTDKDYLPIPPTAKQFHDCCNEFWWVAPYVAKGLWRGELPYAKHMMETYVREALTRMLNWHIGNRTEFAASPGKLSKYYEKLLEPQLWDAYTRTYADGAYENIWQGLFVMCELFRKTAQGVATHFGYQYPQLDDQRAFAHLHHVKGLPKEASAYDE